MSVRARLHILRAIAASMSAAAALVIARFVPPHDALWRGAAATTVSAAAVISLLLTWRRPAVGVAAHVTLVTVATVFVQVVLVLTSNLDPSKLPTTLEGFFVFPLMTTMLTATAMVWLRWPLALGVALFAGLDALARLTSRA